MGEHMHEIHLLQQKILSCFYEGHILYVNDFEASHRFFYDASVMMFRHYVDGYCGEMTLDLKDEKEALIQIEAVCRKPLSGYEGLVLWQGVLHQLNQP